MVGLARASRYRGRSDGQVSDAEENPIPGNPGSPAIGVVELCHRRTRLAAAGYHARERSSHTCQDAAGVEVKLKDPRPVAVDERLPADVHVARGGSGEVGVIKG